MCERLRKCDKAAELMSERGRVNVLGGVREGKRGGNKGKEKVGVCTSSSEEFMSGVKTHL